MIRVCLGCTQGYSHAFGDELVIRPWRAIACLESNLYFPQSLSFLSALQFSVSFCCLLLEARTFTE